MILDKENNKEPEYLNWPIVQNIVQLDCEHY